MRSYFIQKKYMHAFLKELIYINKYSDLEKIYFDGNKWHKISNIKLNLFQLW